MLSKDSRTILVFALRYALPRHSYALGLVSDYIKLHVNSFEDWEISNMLHDIAEFYPNDAFGGLDQERAEDFRRYLAQVLEVREAAHRLGGMA